MQLRVTLLTLGLFSIISSPSLFADYAIKVTNTTDIISTLSSFDKKSGYTTNLKNQKIAILGKGFSGVYPKPTKNERYLIPPDRYDVVTEYPELKNNEELKKRCSIIEDDAHDAQMGMATWAVSTGYDEKLIGPNLKFFNVACPEYFMAAVERLIDWGADIVICSQNWEYMGNFDGSGPINERVREAVDEGVIFLVAAGNYGGQVYDSIIKEVKTNDTGLPYVFFQENNSPYIRFKNNADENDLTAVLAWNKFSPGWDIRGTDVDMDLYLYRQKEGEDPVKIAKASDIQVRSNPNEESGETLYAREKIVFKDLPRTRKDETYLLAVLGKENNSFKDKIKLNKDRLRITIYGSKREVEDVESKKLVRAIKLLDTKGSEIPVPADGYGLAIGDTSKYSAKGRTPDGREKPDIVFPYNTIRLSNLKSYFGTSYANALFGGLVSRLLAINPGLKQHHLLKFRTNNPSSLYLNAGWANVEYRNFYGNQDALAWLKENYGKDNLFVLSDSNKPSPIGIKGDFFNKFSGYDLKIKNNPEDYRFFLRLGYTSRKVQKFIDPQYRNERVMVRRGYKQPYRSTEYKKVREGYYDYYNEQEWTGRYMVDAFTGSSTFIDLNRGQIVRIKEMKNVRKKKWVPAEYDNVPVTKYRDVAPEYQWQKVLVQGTNVWKWVDGKPSISYSFAYQAKDSKTPIWDRYKNYSNGKAPGDFQEIVPVDLEDGYARGLLGHSTPRIWSTPLPYEFEREVNR